MWVPVLWMEGSVVTIACIRREYQKGARHDGGVVLVRDASYAVDAICHYLDVGGVKISSLRARHSTLRQ